MMQKLTHDEIVERQKERIKQPRIPLVVVLNDIRSLHNVGSILRTADGAGVEKVWLCGITGYPPNKQISKTALGAEDQVDWDCERDVVKVVRDLKSQGYQIVLLEQTEDSIFYEEFSPTFPTCLVVGNEVSGISEELFSFCDYSLEIEMAGIKNSLNAPIAFGVVAYYYRSRFKALANQKRC